MLSKMTMDTKLVIKEFKELTSDHTTSTADVKARLDNLGPWISNYGDSFRKMHDLCFAAVCFAFENNVISPVQYVKKIKKFSFVLVQVLESKWGAVLRKSDNTLSKKLVVQLIVDFVRAGAATERCMIGGSSMEIVGAFGMRVGMTKDALSAVRIASKYDIELVDVRIVLEKMGMSAPHSARDTERANAVLRYNDM
jgi:hypothetical protein